jgi:preprotein translocase subunit SecD
MNKFPAWKYALLIVALGLGAIYALPNLFGDDPSVQISSTRGFELPKGD